MVLHTAHDGGPYRGVDDSPPAPPSLTTDQMMTRMQCKIEYSSYHKVWEASILWMERDNLRAFITATGNENSEAVSNLYDHFKRMQSEGWKRTS